MPLAQPKERIQDIRFCAACAETQLAGWRGWPHRDPIPLPPVLRDGTCPQCHGRRELPSGRIAWLTIHSQFSTGLPDYWVLSTSSDELLTRDLQSKWGLPYSELYACPRCGSRAFSSVHGRFVRRQCSSCDYVRRERLK